MYEYINRQRGFKSYLNSLLYEELMFKCDLKTYDLHLNTEIAVPGTEMAQPILPLPCVTIINVNSKSITLVLNNWNHSTLQFLNISQNQTYFRRSYNASLFLTYHVIKIVLNCKNYNTIIVQISNFSTTLEIFFGS